MLKENDTVSVFKNATEYKGTVIGAEGDEFWLLVSELNQVQRGHVSNLYQLSDGKKFLSAAEWIADVETLFDERGGFSSDIFVAFQSPEPIIKILKIYRLLRIPSNGPA